MSDDVWSKIFSYLDLSGLRSVYWVCTSWQRLCQPYWKHYYYQLFSHPDALYNTELIEPKDEKGETGEDLYWSAKFNTRNEIERLWEQQSFQKFNWKLPLRVGTQQFSQKEQIYIAGSTSGKIHIYDINPLLQNKQPLQLLTLEGHQDAVRGIQFDADKLLSGSRDKTIRIWKKPFNYDQKVSKDARTLHFPDNVNALMFQGSQVVAGLSSGELRLVDLETGQALSSRPEAHDKWIRHIQFTNTTILSAGADRQIHQWDSRALPSGPVRTLSGHTDCVTAVQFHGSRAVSGGYDSLIKIWDLASGRCERDLNYHEGGSIRSLQYDGRKLITGCGNCSVYMYLWAEERHCVIHRTASFVSSVRFSKDVLVVSSADPAICMMKVSRCPGVVQEVPKPVARPPILDF